MQLAIRALTHRQVAPRGLDVDVDLGGGRRLTGTVAQRLRATGWSRSATPGSTPSSCSAPGCSCSRCRRTTRTTTGPRSSSAGHPAGRTRGARLFAPVDAEAGALLADLVAVYDAGRREPLPLPLKTSFAWAQARQTGRRPGAWPAERRWLSRQFDGENADPAHVRVWGANAPLAVAARHRPGRARSGRARPPGSGRYAARVWEPMLRFEQAAL